MCTVRIPLLITLLMLLNIGCHPGVRVKKNPTAADTGIRYYRPKPYLLLKPGGASRTTGTGVRAITNLEISDQTVEISLEYLPDFAEEYSLNVRSGLGVANVSITLEDGWNLTAINQELDSKFADNVKALADLADSATGFIPTSADETPEGSGKVQQKWVVQATNVPLGYYEAVINEDECGKRRLSGWRYVGFAPFNGGAIVPCGQSGIGSSCDVFEVYGLGFRNGVMVFSSLEELRTGGRTERTNVNTGIVAVDFEATDAKTTNQHDAFRSAVKDQLKSLVLTDKAIAVVVSGRVVEVEIEVLPEDYDVKTSEEWSQVQQVLQANLLGEAQIQFASTEVASVSVSIRRGARSRTP